MVELIASYDFDNLLKLMDQTCEPELKEMINKEMVKISCPSGTELFSEGEEVHHMMFVKKGKVKIVTRIEGESKLIRLASDGNIIGHRGIGFKLIFPVSAIALTEVTVIRIPIKLFFHILKSNTLFGFNFSMFIAEELRRSELQMRSLAVQPVYNRIARAIDISLEAFGKDKSGKLNFTLSRKDYASLASTTYESTVRSISKLVSEKVIKLEGKTITVLNMAKLKELSGARE